MQHKQKFCLDLPQFCSFMRAMDCLFAAVKFLKGTSVRQFRRSVGIRNEEGVVATNEKDKTAVSTR